MGKTTSRPEYVPLTGVILLVIICFLWGGNIVSIKFSNMGIPPLMAATVRSVLASLFLWLYAASKGERLFVGRRHLKYGVGIGFLFGVDFLFLYLGVAYTDASRAVIFLYTHPLWVALGAHFLLPDDRLTVSKVLGLCLAFGGLVSVFRAEASYPGPDYWIGDLLEVAAAIFWAATTVYIKKFIRDKPVTHYQTLFAQLFFSIPVLLAGSLVLEWGRPLSLTASVLLALAYQTVIVAFFSYLVWFWMIHHYPVSRLTAFTFLAPLFGVILSGIILGEAMTVLLWIGLLMVAGGIYLVNRPEAPRVEAGSR